LFSHFRHVFRRSAACGYFARINNFFVRGKSYFAMLTNKTPSNVILHMARF
jgi:hypothetical protein